jgi:hypothetical protein
MVKALLINGAEDLRGGVVGASGIQTPIPNYNQGWGRVNLNNIVLDYPQSDRGPRLCVNHAAPFTANLQKRAYQVAPADETRPLRVTLVWTDAPAAQNSNPARVNNLNLAVKKLPDGPTFKGNNFVTGFSVAGGDYKDLDNVECVYIEQPAGRYEVRVIAACLSRNARPPFNSTAWQDFALVMDNAVWDP